MQKDVTTRNAMVDAATALVNGGTMEMRDSGDNTLVTFTLQATAFAAAVNGVGELNAVSATAATDSGTIAKLAFIDTGSNVRFTMSVPSEVTVSPTNVISNGQVISVTSIFFTEPLGS